VKSIVLACLGVVSIVGACSSPQTRLELREERRSRLVVEGITCLAGCPTRIESALRRVPGVRTIEMGALDQATRSAAVTVTGKASADELIAAFEGTQYRVQLD
jgi:copper chaperone CopZ